MIYDLNIQARDELRKIITQNYLIPEHEIIPILLKEIESIKFSSIKIKAAHIIDKARKFKDITLVQKLMQKFSLSSDEGIALMCLAEALLRIPDKETQKKLIKDKINNKNWNKEKSSSITISLASLGLNFSEKILTNQANNKIVNNLIQKFGEPIIHQSINLAMKLMGKQFVISQNIEEAISIAKKNQHNGFSYSFDMLGEAAVTLEDSKQYFSAYKEAIIVIGQNSKGKNIYENDGISIKLSALNPKYTYKNKKSLEDIYLALKELVFLAKTYNIGINIDAEETEKLDISLDLFTKLCHEEELQNWNGLGFVVQAYQKRAFFILDYLINLAKNKNMRFMIRLVKGAYWDSEIKNTQIKGFEDYPVYTRKYHTDISYLACSKKMLVNSQYIYPQFATHNAVTIASILEIVKNKDNLEYEFQCLYGMGEQIYKNILQEYTIKCRVYAPVGKHNKLLPYLVRRLLENGANTSFINQLSNQDNSIDDLLDNPIEQSKALLPVGKMNDKILLPSSLYKNRKNSKGVNVANEIIRNIIQDKLNDLINLKYDVTSLVSDTYLLNNPQRFITYNPSDLYHTLGTVEFIDIYQVNKACLNATQGFINWNKISISERGDILNKAADLIESDKYFYVLIDLLIREAGKTLENAIGEIREAVDFLRYYTVNINTYNTYRQIQGIGAVACISPWNFPLSIFIGQISACLIAGNSVIAKPAEQTCIIAAIAAKILHEAGVPKNALQVLLGYGEDVGHTIVNNQNIQGIIFTGSIETAKIIQKNIANRLSINNQPIIFIAETGGQNAMIIDSTCLPEQTVQDIILSAFDSSGQRCSALRLLCIQEEVYETITSMLEKAMNELKIINPINFQSDISCVIDKQSYDRIISYKNKFKTNIYTPNIESDSNYGYFCTPSIIYLNNISELGQEIFGPILHIIKYKKERLNILLNQINNLGYGLTMGIQSRIDNTIDYIISKVQIGNIYVNRNTIGAVVGVQPFGGEGLSGTGAKAGGPLYLGKLIQHSSEYNNLILDLMQSQNNQDNKSISLNSYTGEENNYSLKTKKNILCIADNTDDLLKQLTTILSINAKPVILNEQKNLLNSIEDIDKDNIIIEKNISNIENLGAVLVNFHDNYEIINILNLISIQYKKIIPLIMPSQDGSYSLFPLVHERSISINTSACGGNTKLLSL